MEINAFGRLADIINNKEIRLDSITTTDQLRQALQSYFPSLSGIGYTIAVNNMIMPNNTMLNPNDKIALLPPYSGG